MSHPGTGLRLLALLWWAVSHGFVASVVVWAAVYRAFLHMLPEILLPVAVGLLLPAGAPAPPGGHTASGRRHALWLAASLAPWAVTFGVDFVCSRITFPGDPWALVYAFGAVYVGAICLFFALPAAALRLRYHRHPIWQWLEAAARHLVGGLALGALAGRLPGGALEYAAALIHAALTALVLGVQDFRRGLLSGLVWAGLALLVAPWWAPPREAHLQAGEVFRMLPFILGGTCLGVEAGRAYSRWLENREGNG